MKRAVAAITCLLLMVTNASAWSHDAHRAIAIVAHARLTPQAKAKLKSIFGHAVDLADMSLCADEVRSYERAIEQGETFTLSPACAAVFPDPPSGTDRWHYVDVNVDFEKPTDAQISDACKGSDNCAVTQIPRHYAVLRNSGASKEERAKAATFLIHFVGDIHQPLHGAERKDDAGGNNVQVVLLSGEASRLHGIWDGDIPRLIADSDEGIVSKVGSEIKAAEKEKPQHVSQWVFTWARESHRVSRDVVYKGVALPPAVTKLDQKYAENAVTVAKERIAQAGVRLAAVLNAALK